jgi:hypothetical protein
MTMGTKAKIAASLITATALVTVAVACGSSDPRACFVIDASQSTRYALFDYEERFAQSLEETAEAGDSVAVVVATGDPLVESNVEREDFSGLTNADQGSDRSGAIEDLASRVERTIQVATGTLNPTPGSGIVAAIALVAGQGCASVEVLSDGLEASDVRMKRDDIITAGGRDRLLDRLAERGLLPDLDGVELRFPFGGYLPQGTAIPQARLDALPTFWSDYAERTGATFSWRQ